MCITVTVTISWCPGASPVSGSHRARVTGTPGYIWHQNTSGTATVTYMHSVHQVTAVCSNTPGFPLLIHGLTQSNFL